MIRRRRLLAVWVLWSASVVVPTPGPAATIAQSALAVGVHAGLEATVGAAYDAGHAIRCNDQGCSGTAVLSGRIRTTRRDAGGASVALSGVAITASGGVEIPRNAIRMSCSGGTVGTPTFAGTPVGLARDLPLSDAALTCGAWSGTLVANYLLSVVLAVDPAFFPQGGNATVTFTATATAN